MELEERSQPAGGALFRIRGTHVPARGEDQLWITVVRRISWDGDGAGVMEGRGLWRTVRTGLTIAGLVFAFNCLAVVRLTAR